MTSRLVITVALKLCRQYEAEYAAYVEMCGNYRRRGYTPRTCEHGTNRWVEYDNICGHCEDGFSMGDPMTRRQCALMEARSRVADADEIFTFVSTANKLGLRDAIDIAALKTRINELLLTA